MRVEDIDGGLSHGAHVRAAGLREQPLQSPRGIWCGDDGRRHHLPPRSRPCVTRPLPWAPPALTGSRKLPHLTPTRARSCGLAPSSGLDLALRGCLPICPPPPASLAAAMFACPAAMTYSRALRLATPSATRHHHCGMREVLRLLLRCGRGALSQAADGMLPFPTAQPCAAALQASSSRPALLVSVRSLPPCHIVGRPFRRRRIANPQQLPRLLPCCTQHHC